MPTVMRMRWSGLTPDQYEEARQIVNWEGDTPNGARFHIAWFEGNDLRVVDLWDSPENFQTFVNDRLGQQRLERAGSSMRGSTTNGIACSIAPNVTRRRRARRPATY